MSRKEAQECINAIKGNLESLRRMFLELHRRRGWEVLGYASFRECAVAEFGQGQAYIYRLVQAAEVEENLATFASTQISTIVESENIPVTQLTELAKLPPEHQVEGLLRAEQIAIAKRKKRNATHVAQAVKEINPKKQALVQPPSAALAKPTDKPRTGWDISPQALTTTVKGHKIAVHFERRGEEFFFGFKGASGTISASGFYSESVSDRALVTREYLNPGVWADFRAEELYSDYQQSLSEDAQTDDQPLVAVDAALDQPEQSPTLAVPPALVPAQMLDAAVSACLGEFWIPENLDESLQGKVYISPGQPVGQWVTRLLRAYKSGSVQEAIALLTLDHQAFIKFADYALCPLPDGLVAVYLGKRIDSFILCFEALGTVWHRYGCRP